MFRTRTPWGRLRTSIGTLPANAGPRATARVISTCSPGRITTRSGVPATLRFGSGVTVIQPAVRPAGIDVVDQVAAPELEPVRTARPVTRQVGGEKAGAVASAERARMRAVVARARSAPRSRSFRAGAPRPSRRPGRRTRRAVGSSAVTSVVPPRGTFGFSVPRESWKSGRGVPDDQVVAERRRPPARARPRRGRRTCRRRAGRTSGGRPSRSRGRRRRCGSSRSRGPPRRRGRSCPGGWISTL